MQEQDQKRIEAVVSMFSTEGWKYFIEDVEEQVQLHTSTAPTQCVKNDDWQYRRGEIAKLEQIVNYENAIRTMLEYSQEEMNASEDV